MSLIVNRRDIDFLLYEVLGADTLLTHARYANHDRAAIDRIFDVAEAIAEEHYLPCAAELDANEPRFVDGGVEIIPAVRTAIEMYAQAGFFMAGFDEADGGLQLPWIVTVLLNGIFSCANLSIANYAFLTTANANMLRAFGTDTQKRVFLPPMLEGRWLGTMCLSEPQAGSSLADIRTRAEPLADGGYRISGSKMWISGGDHALSENIVHMVLARMPGSPPGVKGLSLFLVPKYRVRDDGGIGADNHIALAGLNHKMGQRGTVNCLLNFGETGDSVGTLVGAPGQGLACMFHMMNEARIGVGMSAVMSALAGYLYSLDYAQTRLQGRPLGDKDARAPQVPIIEHADVRRMLLAQKAAVEGGLALVAHCALLVDRRKIAAGAQERERLELLLELLTPIAKSWPSEHCLEANKLAIQILGGYGYTRDYPVERHYRDNRLNHIHEGTYGIQAIDLLGRKVQMRDGAALTYLVDDIGKTLAAARSLNVFAEETGALEKALTELQATTRAVRACPDPARGLANATLYLDAAGHIVVAWMWMRQALAAQKRIAQGADATTAAFCKGKLAAFRYFFRYALPGASTQLALVAALDDTCLAIQPKEFIGR